MPAEFLSNRYGVDYARLRTADGEARDVVVQRGQETSDGIEIVSGLSAGDVLVRP